MVKGGQCSGSGSGSVVAGEVQVVVVRVKWWW